MTDSTDTRDLIQIRNLLISPRQFGTRLAARRGLDYDDLFAECVEDRIRLASRERVES